MVTAGDEGRPRRRTKRGGVELGVTQACLGNAVQVRRRNDTAEGAGYPVTLVISHDEEDVGRVLRRHDTGRPPRRRILGGFLDHSAKFGGWCWELFAVYCRCRTSRAQLACHLLGRGCRNG